MAFSGQIDFDPGRLAERALAFIADRDSATLTSDALEAPHKQLVVSRFSENSMAQSTKQTVDESAQRLAAAAQIESMISQAKNGLDGGVMSPDRQALVDRLESLRDQVISGVLPLTGVAIVMDQAKGIAQQASSPTLAEASMRKMVDEVRLETIEKRSKQHNENVAQSRIDYQNMRAIRDESMAHPDLVANVDNAESLLGAANARLEAALSAGDVDGAASAYADVTRRSQELYGAQSGDALYTLGQAELADDEKLSVNARVVLDGNRDRVAQAIAEEIHAREMAGETLTNDQRTELVTQRVEQYNNVLRNAYDLQPAAAREHMSFEEYTQYRVNPELVEKLVAQAREEQAAKLAKKTKENAVTQPAETGADFDKIRTQADAAVAGVKDKVTGVKDVVNGSTVVDEVKNKEVAQTAAVEKAAEGEKSGAAVAV